MDEIVTDGKSHVKVQKTANASVMDGYAQPGVALLSGLGTNGKHKQNMARDYERHVRKAIGQELLEPFEFKLPCYDRRLNKIKAVDHTMFLPHETFSYMTQWPQQFEARVLAGGVDAVKAWWHDSAHEASCHM